MFQCSTCEQGGQEDCRSVFQCIDEGLVCDRSFHCITGKDEYGGQCVEDRGYDCEDGSFASQNARCNGVFSCSNDRDEVDCPTCANNACEESSCNETKLRCDGFAHCLDGRDEWNCGCPEWRKFRCGCNQMGNYTCSGTGWKCYSDIEKCDGDAHCEDGSDEENCEICPEANPNICACKRLGNESCGGLQCYPDAWKCDGFMGCDDGSDEWNCECPSHRPLPCACNQNGTSTCALGQGQCYSEEIELCNGNQYCSDGSDEWNCDPCPPQRPLKCGCNQQDNTCQRVPCIAESYRCDGTSHCEDDSDELDCDVCTLERPHRCACNQVGNNTCLGSDWQCYREGERCDTRVDCRDDSDELNCTCPMDTFKCPCFRDRFPLCPMSEGCLPMHYVNDGKCDCDDCSDEEQIITAYTRKCGSCDVTVFWMNDTSVCISPWCDVTTCYRVPSLECLTHDCEQYQHICTSSCSNDTTAGDCKVLQCADRSLIFAAQDFCNIRTDCADGSDEIIQDFGFKCSPTFSLNQCLLPQWNLYDNVAQCYDNSDLCFDEDGSFHCFRCVDNDLIIASRQVCDGRIDCYDASDECLCENANASTMCQQTFFYTNPIQCSGDVNSATENSGSIQSISELSTLCTGTNCQSSIQDIYVNCFTKETQIQATLCDGRPECKDFSDECSSCPAPPDFCFDDCASFYQLGDRYCDGEIDEAWIYLNRSDCPKGFDERNCPKRFKCPTGSKVSVDVLQVCDGRADCDDRSDESNCPSRYKCEARGGFVSIPTTMVLDGQRDCLDGSDEFIPGIFSSRFNLIGNRDLERWFWIAAVIIILGNAHAFVLNVKKLKEQKTKPRVKPHDILILNLTLSDCLMGVYLFIILGKGVEYAGRYSEFDYEWRTSTLCSIAGMICMISSEASCFVILTLTIYRMFFVLLPSKSRLLSNTTWIVAVTFAWIASFLLALLPNTLPYFSRGYVFISQFSSSDTVSNDFLMTFACRLSHITNKTMDEGISDPEGRANAFLGDNFPQFAPLGEIGFYGTTSVCLPTFFANPTDRFWIYSLVIISCNLVSFLSVCAGYIMIWKKTSSSEQAKKQSGTVQRRITGLIITDMVCWIPICIMAYLSIAGVHLPPGIEIFTAGVLLPINSALNPLIYSTFVERYMISLGEKLRSVVRTRRRR
ncbi:uncharacterized protein LOC143471428 [Clavelina lepadiformis]